MFVSSSDIVCFKELNLGYWKLSVIKSQTHYDITDKNKNFSFNCLDIRFN